MSTIYQVLKNDHDTHREILKKLSQTQGDSQERNELWQRFYYDIKSHAAAEEESFYAPLMAKPDGQDKARHSVAEHKDADDLLDELNEMDFSSPQWLPKFKQLRHDYEHHINEEEEEIFACAKTLFDKSEAEAMAKTFTTRKTKERGLVEEKAEAKLTV